MKREGSPWTGLWAVVLKELADHLTSVRMRVVEIIVLLTAVATVYAATTTLRNVVGEDPFLYLRVFTLPNRIGDTELPSFMAFMSFFMPLIGIALAFDSVNGEFLRRTMSRILAQPIYRDAVLVGKFLAGMATLATGLVALWLLVTGLAMLRLGVVPEGREVVRGLCFLFATLAYGGVWLALALLFSVTFRQPATSALAAIGVWLFFVVFWQIVAGILANLVGVVAQNELTLANLQLFLYRLSPITLYTETALALLSPELRTLGPLLGAVLQAEAAGIIPRSLLPLSQSLLLIWPQFVGMLAAVILLFAYAYVQFQRQEVRA